MSRNEAHWKQWNSHSLESQVLEIKQENNVPEPQNTQAVAPPEPLLIPIAETKEEPESAQGKKQKNKTKKTRKKKESE